MKTILLMRHSHAVSDNSAYSDHQRPLSEAGRILAVETSQLLQDISIDRVICSSAARTVETADLVSKTCGLDAVPDVTQSLYLAPPDSYRTIGAKVAEPADQTLTIIGHNPGIASLICQWAGDSMSVPPATVAIFYLQIDNWTELTSGHSLRPELVGFISSGVRHR